MCIRQPFIASANAELNAISPSARSTAGAGFCNSLASELIESTVSSEALVPDADFDPAQAQALNERVWKLGFAWAGDARRRLNVRTVAVGESQCSSPKQRPDDSTLVSPRVRAVSSSATE